MKFRVEHTFAGVSLADYERVYFDETFNEAMCKAVRLERKLVRRDETGGRLVRVVRVAPDRQLPAPVAKILGGAKIEYHEHLDYQLGSYRGSWRTEPSLLVDKIESRGTFGFEARGSSVLRWVEGEVKVKIFGVGSVIERFIVGDVEKSYDDVAAFTRQYLADKAKA